MQKSPLQHSPWLMCHSFLTSQGSVSTAARLVACSTPWAVRCLVRAAGQHRSELSSKNRNIRSLPRGPWVGVCCDMAWFPGSWFQTVRSMFLLLFCFTLLFKAINGDHPRANKCVRTFWKCWGSLLCYFKQLQVICCSMLQLYLKPCLYQLLPSILSSPLAGHQPHTGEDDGKAPGMWCWGSRHAFCRAQICREVSPYLLVWVRAKALKKTGALAEPFPVPADPHVACSSRRSKLQEGWLSRGKSCCREDALLVLVEEAPLPASARVTRSSPGTCLRAAASALAALQTDEQTASVGLAQGAEPTHSCSCSHCFESRQSHRGSLLWWCSMAQ